MKEYYKEMLKEGLAYQQFVEKFINSQLVPLNKQAQNDIGENLFGMEVKYDRKYKETGNLYIETHEKTNENNEWFVKSGILKEDNSWLWAQGDYEELYIFLKEDLLQAHYSDVYRKVTKTTSQGFLIPKRKAQQLVKRYFNMVQPNLFGGE